MKTWGGRQIWIHFSVLFKNCLRLNFWKSFSGTPLLPTFTIHQHHKCIVHYSFFMWKQFITNQYKSTIWHSVLNTIQPLTRWFWQPTLLVQWDPSLWYRGFCWNRILPYFPLSVRESVSRRDISTFFNYLMNKGMKIMYFLKAMSVHEPSPLVTCKLTPWPPGTL